MPSVFETVMSLMTQGDTINKLGALLGAEPDQTTDLVKLATPAIIGSLADRAAEPAGIDAIGGALDRLDGSIVDDVGTFFEQGDPTIGAGLLDSVLGRHQHGLGEALTSQSGAPESTIARLLPMLAPVILGALGRRRDGEKLDATGVTSLLVGEKADLAAAGLFDFGRLGRGATATAGALAAAGAGTTATAAATLTRPGSADNAIDAGPATGRMPSGAERTESGIGQRPDDNHDGEGPGWLLWALGGLAAVLLLAWALSQCGGGDVDAETNRGDSTEDGSGTGGDDAVVDTAGNDSADDQTVPFDADDLQSMVDDALADAGISDVEAVVGDDAMVTLSGTVADEATKTAATAAVSGLDGVTSVDDRVLIESGDPTGNPDQADDETDDEPATINEELSLDPITFEVSSATITADGQAVLDEAASYLDANPAVTVEIAGHTDADGEAAANVRLSQARAESVKAYLMDKGIDGERMTPIGYGEEQPIADNGTVEGKARNRRIEFVIQ